MSSFLGRSLVVAATLCFATSATALGQYTGSANRNAPQVTQSITLGKESIDLTYRSITWAAGQWAAALENEATRGEARTRINGAAEKSPLGTFKTSAAITLGGAKVAAGTYKLAFTLDEKFKWQLTLTSDAGAVNCALDLETVEENSKRLVTTLRAGEKDFTAEVLVAFGKQRCVLPVMFEK
jgi:hypothetical protein